MTDEDWERYKEAIYAASEEFPMGDNVQRVQFTKTGLSFEIATGDTGNTDDIEFEFLSDEDC